jgi:hypothetical protein
MGIIGDKAGGANYGFVKSRKASMLKQYYKELHKVKTKLTYSQMINQKKDLRT